MRLLLERRTVGAELTRMQEASETLGRIDRRGPMLDRRRPVHLLGPLPRPRL
jgi:hypothetical protein